MRNFADEYVQTVGALSVLTAVYFVAVLKYAMVNFMRERASLLTDLSVIVGIVMSSIFLHTLVAKTTGVIPEGVPYATIICWTAVARLLFVFGAVAGCQIAQRARDDAQALAEVRQGPVLVGAVDNGARQ
jgi:predicted tellurium resistance membrane protein TerC